MDRKLKILTSLLEVNENHVKAVVNEMCKEIDKMVVEGAFGNTDITLPQKYHGLNKDKLAAEIKKQYIGKQSYEINEHVDLIFLKRVMKMDILVFREYKDKYWYAFKAEPCNITLNRPKTDEEKEDIIENFMKVLTVKQYGGFHEGGHFVCIQPLYHIGVGK